MLQLLPVVLVVTDCDAAAWSIVYWCLLSGLRALQGRKQLQELVSFVKTARDNLDWGPSGPPPLLVKVAPDLSDADKADVAAVVMDTGVDGLVVGNTTISRPGGCVRGLALCMNH